MKCGENKMNKNQEYAVEQIRDFMQTRTTSVTKVVKFEIVEKPTHMLSESQEWIDNPDRTLVWVYATVDVPAEERKNPYLQDDWSFYIGTQGGIKKVTKWSIGSGRKDYTAHVLSMLGRKR